MQGRETGASTPNFTQSNEPTFRIQPLFAAGVRLFAGGGQDARGSAYLQPWSPGTARILGKWRNFEFLSMRRLYR